MGRKSIIPDLEAKIGQSLKPYLSTELRNGKTPEQIGEALGVGKTTVYGLISDFELKDVQKEVRKTIKTGTENELRKLIDRYLDEKKNVVNVSPETIEKDTNMWRLWFWWLEFAGLPLNLNSMLSDEIIVRFFTYIRTEKNRFGRKMGKVAGQSTVLTYRARMDAFIHWLQVKGIIADDRKSNPFTRIPKGKTAKKLPEDMHESIILKVLNSFDESTFEGIRDKTLFSWFLETGQRLKGVESIRMNSFEWETGRGKVIEKGSKQRTIVLSEELRTQVRKYVEIRAPRAKTQALWIADDGRELTDSGIWQMIHKLNDIPGVKEEIARLSPGNRFHPHLFRHLWAKYLVESEVPGFAMMVMGGWEDLELVQHYAAAYAQDKAWAYINKASPLSNIAKR